MFRTDVSTAAPSLPAPNAPGSPGYFTNGSPGGTNPTVVDADWLNGIQEELISVLAAAGVAPAKATHNQVLTALQSMFSGVVGSMRNASMSVAAASASATFTADEVILETALGGLPFRLANYNQTINLAGTGPGGMDTGTAPVSGYVALYAIYNPTTKTASILATNATSSVAPNVYGGGHMPSGYTASALISVWPTNGGGAFVVGFQRDRHISMSSVPAGTFTTNQTNASVTLPVPPNAVSVDLSSNQSTASGATNYNLAIASSSPAVAGLAESNPALQATGLLFYTVISTVYLLTAQTVVITWSVTGGSSPTLSLIVGGYTF